MFHAWYPVKIHTAYSSSDRHFDALDFGEAKGGFIERIGIIFMCTGIEFLIGLEEI